MFLIRWMLPQKKYSDQDEIDYFYFPWYNKDFHQTSLRSADYLYERPYEDFQRKRLFRYLSVK